MQPGTAWICVACVVIALTACGSPDASRPILVDQCFTLGGVSASEITVPITAPSAGTLRVAVRQVGISVVTTLAERDRSVTAPAVSPVERLGVITNVIDGDPQRPLTLRVQSRDSPMIAGQVCVSADLVSAADRSRVGAERAFARAGQAVQTRDWQTAFQNYLNAARGFDTVGLKQWAAQARHAMAELAYWRFHRERDSFALSAAALADTSLDDPASRGALTALQAMALLELPSASEEQGSSRVRDLLGEAARLFTSAALGARELPRLRVLEGFLEYRIGKSADPGLQFSLAARECYALQDWECYAMARQNGAALAEERQDYVAALEAYEDALRSLDSVAAPEYVANISDNLGRLEGEVGLFARSERSRTTAMRLYARLGECSGARRSLSSLGALLVQMGSVVDGSVYLTRAVSLSCDQLLSELRAGRVVESEPSSEATAAPCARSPVLGELSTDGKRAVFQALLSLIDGLLLEGHTAGAQQCVELARKYAASSRNDIQLANATGTVLLQQGRPAMAQLSFRGALNILDDAELPATYDERGTAQLGLARARLAAGETGAARDSAYQALRISSARADVSQIVTSLQLLATSLLESQNPNEAINTLQAAVRLIEQVPIDDLDGEKRATFLATQYAVFAELTELLIQQAAGNEDAAWTAFGISEQGRARSLRHAIGQTTQGTAQLGDQASQGYRDLLSRIATLAEQSGSPERLAAGLETISRPERVATQEAQVLDRQRLLRQLDHLNATLVEYVVGREDMFAFVIDGGRLHVIRLTPRESIAQAAANLTRQLRAAEVVPRRVESAARELARLVLWPISEYITNERIIFVPDDALHTVPFAVLPWSQQQPDQLVVHRAESVLVPSALLIARDPQTNPSAPRDARFALIGDPVFRNAEWRRECMQNIATISGPATSTSRSVADWAELLPRLPGTRQEVAAIAELLRVSHPQGRVETRLRCTATASALRAAADSSTVLLHIATHGRVDAQRPRLSALALTPDSGTADGAAFGLLDILGLRLQSKLVVLSACDTSRGRLLPGEGVLGLAQAFLQAGAASVVASHWRIEDDVTATFMHRFYKYLLMDGLPAATALRRAQLDHVGKEPSHHWAAFSVYGWPDSSL